MLLCRAQVIRRVRTTAPATEANATAMNYSQEMHVELVSHGHSCSCLLSCCSLNATSLVLPTLGQWTLVVMPNVYAISLRCMKLHHQILLHQKGIMGKNDNRGTPCAFLPIMHSWLHNYTVNLYNGGLY